MRRTAYSDRSRLMQIPSIKTQDLNEFMSHPIYKQDINKLYNNITAYLPNPNKSPPQNFLYHRTTKSNIKRPYSVNKTYSELKNKNQDRQTNTKSNKQLWVSAVQENKQIGTPRDSEPRGKLYRGNSFKLEDKQKMQAKQLREATRYSHNARLTNNLTPTSRQEKNSLRKSFHQSSGIQDLLNRNSKQKLEQPKQAKKQDQFFEYVMRFSYRTKKGMIPSNPNKVNQDSFIINPNIQNKTYQHFFAVCDGHGPLGHHVSSYIKNNLPTVVASTKNLQKNPSQNLMKSFQHVYQKLVKQSKIDMTFSGSTIISTYLYQNKLYCSNVGDSRAIMGKFRQKENKWIVIPLSQDHKPCVPKQAERIKKMNGRIQSYLDESGQKIGPLRVWLRNQNVPGLAMTRSFGDLVGASVGVSPVPQIKQYSLTKQDHIILIASDGVFQFLQNQYLIQQLVPFYENKQIQQASDHLLNLAHKTWTKNSSIIDDITFILIFLHFNQI